MLVDLIEDLVDALLGYIRDFLVRLGARYLVIEIVFGGMSFFLSVGIEKVVTPVKKTIDPAAAVISSAKAIDKEPSRACAGQVGDIGAAVSAGEAGKVDQQKDKGQDPERDPPVDHREDAIVGCNGGGGDGYGHDGGIGAGQLGNGCVSLEPGQNGVGQRKIYPNPQSQNMFPIKRKTRGSENI